jgi:outer membrane lipoprotein carrier protein
LALKGEGLFRRLSLFRINTRALWLVFACFLMGSKSAIAVDPKTSEEAVAALESFYTNVQSMQANFVQITRSPSMGTEEEQKGRLVVKRPKKMRWDFTRPDKRLFLTDGQQMWIHSPEDNQVIHYKDVSGMSSGGIDSLLSEMDKLSESFTVVLDTVPKAASIGHFALRLTPKNEAPFKSLYLEVNKRKLTLKRVLVVDTFDNETELRFSGVKVNAEVPDSMFQFEVPAGAELIQPDAL